MRAEFASEMRGDLSIEEERQLQQRLVAVRVRVRDGVKVKLRGRACSPASRGLHCHLTTHHAPLVAPFIQRESDVEKLQKENEENTRQLNKLEEQFTQVR